jgi:UPF0716 protein FxsA
MAVAILLYLVAEVAAIWAVASAIGWWTIVALLAGAFVGSWLARREGGRAIRAAMRTAGRGGSPHREVTDGMLVALGGLLILIPGFVSDAFGLLILFRPTRGLLHKTWLSRIERRSPRVPYPGPYGSPEQRPTEDGTIIEGEVVEEHDAADEHRR